MYCTLRDGLQIVNLSNPLLLNRRECVYTITPVVEIFCCGMGHLQRPVLVFRMVQVSFLVSEQLDLIWCPVWCQNSVRLHTVHTSGVVFSVG